MLSSAGSILAKSTILDEIKKGAISISSPFDPKTSLGPASVDLSLGNEFRLFPKAPCPELTIPIESKTSYKAFGKRIVIPDGKSISLGPGEFMLGITKERIKLGEHICGLLEGRSRFARCGLFVHVTAPFMAPGIDSRQVLELYNCSPYTLELKPGVKVCQFVFLRTEGVSGSYQGHFHLQDDV
ncbi:dCTP deaminase like protein [Aduncisulcus paluster]|uniref:dCTP deaminase like protein n=1 Tax=Aduncisulcus paluster TaxID=2918883 RepID=A0ABQ5KZ86_9EUKA|nr:dCTP deaminase like protein [Aduncisulcus paluster]|eukprot:gnl/Carplike_NY0171/5377_a7341_270.p1 GENE.gnl/Carplike_NY0171/5377_a7341_270~~gnl/Carplike_NY0171/5377_a7341_270.p1  ORF type:complete len:184 (+),score=15.41 gnl/Carplike_NY0171/5377_a7341_270:38-589(+)